MPLIWAEWIARLFYGYAAIGVVFGIPFVVTGARRLDPVAKDGTRGFRLLVFPGVVALWPLLAMRWYRGDKPRVERNAHRNAAGDPT